MANSRRRVDALMALGRAEPPEEQTIHGVAYSRAIVFKHDFFAATSLYQSLDRQLIVKIGRRASLLGLPLSWLGRLAAAHEVAIYERLADVPGIPACQGLIATDTFAHTFIPGHPLQRGECVPATFFPQLQELLAAIHARDVAYVDLEKRENILVGDDGRPYLIDFQISFHCPAGAGWVRRMPRWLLRRLQQSDRYHLMKHWRRHRPDQLTADQLEWSRRRPIWIRLHRIVARPFTRVRRYILQRLTGGGVPAETAAESGR